MRDMPEAQIDIGTVDGGRDVTSTTPLQGEVTSVWQVGDLGDGQGWRTVHTGLQKFLHTSTCRRETRKENKERLKIPDSKVYQLL